MHRIGYPGAIKELVGYVDAVKTRLNLVYNAIIILNKYAILLLLSSISKTILK